MDKQQFNISELFSLSKKFYPNKNFYISSLDINGIHLGVYPERKTLISQNIYLVLTLI